MLIEYDLTCDELTLEDCTDFKRPGRISVTLDADVSYVPIFGAPVGDTFLRNF